MTIGIPLPCECKMLNKKAFIRNSKEYCRKRDAGKDKQFLAGISGGIKLDSQPPEVVHVRMESPVLQEVGVASLHSASVCGFFIKWNDDVGLFLGGLLWFHRLFRPGERILLRVITYETPRIKSPFGHIPIVPLALGLRGRKQH